MLQDLRLAIRRVLRSRGFSISVVLILGAGLGTVAAMAMCFTRSPTDLSASRIPKRSSQVLDVAVGASPASVSSLIIGQAMRITLIGLAMGLPLAVAGASFLSSLLFGIAVADAATLAGSAALLIGAAAIGAAHPAWRAVRVDPATALRAE